MQNGNGSAHSAHVAVEASATNPGTRKSPPLESPAAPDEPTRPVRGEPVESRFWMTHSDRLVLACLSLVVLVLLIVHWARLSGWGTTPVEIDRLESRKYDFRFDVNSATWVEWTQLDGIGDALARRIVADREQNGPFRSIDDLARVKGIGPKTVERLRPWLAIVVPSADGKPLTEAATGQADELDRRSTVE